LNYNTYPYTEWEDYKNGMWRKLRPTEEDYYLQKAIQFTGDHALYGSWMLKVLDQWPKTCDHNLSDPSQNRRAFIGHAACCLAIQCPEYITRSAWGSLTQEQQRLANEQADIAITKWEQTHFVLQYDLFADGDHNA
jgi:hypothetical protein